MKKCFLVIITTVLLSGCGSALTKDYGNGGVIQEHHATQNTEHVASIAYNYCKGRGTDVIALNQIKQGCMLACGSEYDEYEFRCGNLVAVKAAANAQKFELLSKQCVKAGFRKGSAQHEKCMEQHIQLEQAQTQQQILRQQNQIVENQQRAQQRQESLQQLQLSNQLLTGSAGSAPMGTPAPAIVPPPSPLNTRCIPIPGGGYNCTTN
jgi:putative hemolysin